MRAFNKYKSPYFGCKKCRHRLSPRQLRIKKECCAISAFDKYGMSCLEPVYVKQPYAELVSFFKEFYDITWSSMSQYTLAKKTVAKRNK